MWLLLERPGGAIVGSMWKIFRNKKSEAAQEPDSDRDPSEDIVSLPASVMRAIPQDERGGPAVRLEDGRYIVVGRRVLMVSDGEKIVDSGFWHEVQYASWRAEDRVLTLVWTDSDRPSLVAATESENPKEFMEAVTLRVDNTIVATQAFTTSTGVNVAASVRRRFDGHLFSTIVSSGPVSEADEARAMQLEADLRSDLNME